MAKIIPRIGVGIGLFVLNSDGNILLGERSGALGSSTHGLPGGHLEVGETFEACASRELLEETGLSIPASEIRFLTATNQPDLEGHHYVTVFMGCRIRGGDEVVARNLEGEKCKGWEWVGWGELRGEGERGVGGEVVVEVVDGKVGGKGGGRRLFRPLYDLFEQRKGFTLNCL